MTHKNLYDLLEVSPGATQEEIKGSYRLIISMLHPDKFPQNSKQWTRAHEKTQEINEAYEILKDPERRSQYDRELCPRTSNASPEQTQTSTSTSNSSTSPPASSYSSSPPPVSHPETEVKTTAQDHKNSGCGRAASGFLSLICFAGLIFNLTSGFTSETPIIVYISLVVPGIIFLIIAVIPSKKS